MLSGDHLVMYPVLHDMLGKDQLGKILLSTQGNKAKEMDVASVDFLANFNMEFLKS